MFMRCLKRVGFEYVYQNKVKAINMFMRCLRQRYLLVSKLMLRDYIRSEYKL